MNGACISTVILQVGPSHEGRMELQVNAICVVPRIRRRACYFGFNRLGVTE